jgi:hypothetical protein
MFEQRQSSASPTGRFLVTRVGVLGTGAVPMAETASPPQLDVLLVSVRGVRRAVLEERALRGDVGQLTIGPHLRASAHDELPLVCRKALAHVGPDCSPLARWLPSFAQA